MTALRQLRNIGAIAAAELERAGIADGESLQKAGSIGAAIRLRAAGFEVCRSKLSGLEGAIRGIRWNRIPATERNALWMEFSAAAGDKAVPARRCQHGPPAPRKSRGHAQGILDG